MEFFVTLRQVKKRFESAGISYKEFELQEGYKLLVVPELGRYLGPFGGKDDRSLGWVSETIKDEAAFARFLEKGEWNLGGDRLWVAPEFPFFVKKRQDFYKTYTVQKGMDPGRYSLSEKNGRLLMASELQAELYEHSWKSKNVLATRSLQQIENPLRHLENFGEMMKGVDYIGYEQEICMEDVSPENPMELEIWNLLQLPGGGTYFIPYLGDKIEYVDYYAVTGNELLQEFENYAKLQVRAFEEHKVGFQSAITVGRIGYLRKIWDGESCLLIRNYFNDPSDAYIKDPFDQPGKTGCSLFVYMNDQRGDGFTEMESSGRTFGGNTGKSGDVKTLGYWYYVGEEKNLLRIASKLLGVK